MARPSLPPRKHWIALARTTTSLRFQKVQLRRSTAFKSEAGSTRWWRPGFQVSLQEAADVQTPWRERARCFVPLRRELMGDLFGKADSGPASGSIGWRRNWPPCGDSSFSPFRGGTHLVSGCAPGSDLNIARGSQSLPNVDPVFTWVRLTQRIPVRIEINHVPDNVVLAAGQTCTVVVESSR